MMDIQKWLIVGGLAVVIFPLMVRKESWLTKRLVALCLCSGILLVTAGVAVRVWSAPMDVAERKEFVLGFEKEILRQDAIMNAAYAPFRKACADLSPQDIPVTARAAIEAAGQCNYSIHHIDVPKGIPSDLAEVLTHIKDNAAASCFARGKIAGNILHQLTGEGEVYSTVESLAAEHENFYVQAGLGLGMAKVMVGISE